MRYLALLSAILSAPALAKQLTVHVGPPSIGNGGSNPISIPPLNPIEYEVVYITKTDREWCFALTPGIFGGMRSEFGKYFYSSFGGGLVINTNGTGPGIYSSIGANIQKFNVEFKQALGFNFSDNQLLSPYAIRIGLTFNL